MQQHSTQEIYRSSREGSNMPAVGPLSIRGGPVRSPPDSRILEGIGICMCPQSEAKVDLRSEWPRAIQHSEEVARFISSGFASPVCSLWAQI